MRPLNPTGGLRQFLVGRSLLGSVDGVNKVFTSPDLFVRDALYQEVVYVRGLRRTEGVGYDYVASESGGIGTGFDTITFAVAPKTGDNLSIDYFLFS